MIARMLVRMGRKIFTADVIALILVFFALQTLTYGISASLQNTDTKYFFHTCLVSALIGFGLGKSKLNGIPASAGIAALGIVGVWILGAGLAVPLLAYGKAVAAVIPQIIPALKLHTDIDTNLMVEAWKAVVELSSALSLRWQSWFVGVSRNVTVNDALIRNMIWMLILWLVSAWVGWFASKRNAMLSLLPCVFLLASVISYSEYKIESLWLMVVLLLLLMGVWNYKNHTRQWETRMVDYSESIQYDAGQAVILLSVAIAIIAFVTPSVSWSEIREFLRERNRADNEAANALGIQQPGISAINVQQQKPELPRDHLLSGGFANSQKIVMTIRTGELPPIPTSVLTVPPPRHYWRSVTYDVYVSAGWETSYSPAQSIQANTPLIPGLLNGYKLLHMDVDMIEPDGQLFWSGMLYSVDAPLIIDWRVRPQSSLLPDQSVLLQSDIFTARTKATAYKAESYIPVATIAELRAASTEYSEDIARRYLTLPSSVPRRVRDLAKEITRGANNPYDKAVAIESYLRVNYPYDLQVPVPPEDRDVADYFLFDLKKGYCDYYATAMVVLARSSGLPARFVSGYAPGSYDTPNAEYIVRELDAHSWAEIYFPEIGWVEFEPTASQPEIERPVTDDPAAVTQSQQSPALQLIRRFHLEKAIYWMTPLFGLLALVLIYFLLVERWLYLRLSPTLAIERIYRRLYRSGRPFAGERTHAETIHEFANRLIDKINEINDRLGYAKLLSRLRRDAVALTDLYQSTLFVDYRVQKKDARTAWRTWTHLRWRLLLAQILLYRVKRMPKEN